MEGATRLKYRTNSHPWKNKKKKEKKKIHKKNKRKTHNTNKQNSYVKLRKYFASRANSKAVQMLLDALASWEVG